MVAALILFLLLIVFLAFFVGRNLTNVCTIWFFKEFSQVSVATLVFITFACGILCALLLLLLAKLRKSKKAAEKEAKTEVEEKKKEEKKSVNKSKSIKNLFSKNKKSEEKKDLTVTESPNSDETIVEQSISKE